MANLLQSNRVLYMCSCEEYQPLYSLFFCRHCTVLRCHNCASEEIDALFCPHCLETANVGEARLKKNTCANCHVCPICESVLATRTTGENVFHLVCNVCRWSTKDSDTPEHNAAGNWPIHETSLGPELTKVMEKLKALAAIEKSARDQAKSNKRRLMPSGNLMINRFGLQAMYQRKKKSMENPLPQVPIHEPTEEFPPLDFSQLDEPTALPLKSIMRQPTAADKPRRLVRMNIKAKKALRCKECDHNLVKLDLGPCNTKYKVHNFARSHVPEVRLSREPVIVSEASGFSVFLTVSNESNAKAEVLLLPDPETPGIEWITPMVELALPRQDEASDIYESQRTPSSGECVVFRRRHRAGIRLEVKSTGNSEEAVWLGVLLKFKNELCSTKQEAPEWNLTRLRIRLQA